MKKIFKNLAFFTALVAVASSCQKNEIIDDSDVVNEGDAIAVIELSNLKTYGPTSPSTEPENRLTSIEFYVFDDVGQPDATRSYYKPATVSQTVSFAVASGNNKKFVVVANMDLGDLTTLGVPDYNGFRAVLANKVLDNNTSTYIAPGQFIMSGETVADVVLDKADNRVQISLARLVSKIKSPEVLSTVVIDLPATDIEELWGPGTTVTNSDITFELNGFGIVNGLDKSSVLFTGNAAGDDSQTWDTWSHTGKTYYASTFDPVTHDFTSLYSGFESGSWLRGSNEVVYVYENEPVDDGNTGMPGFTKESVYAAIIKGTFKDGSGSSIERYWRINYIKEDNYKTFRNSVYEATITSVISKGYENPEEAEEDSENGPNIPDNKQTGVLVSIDVLDWSLKAFDTEI